MSRPYRGRRPPRRRRPPGGARREPPRRGAPARPSGTGPRPPSGRYPPRQKKRASGESGTFRARHDPKGFELRRGRSSSDSESEEEDSDAVPLSHVVLPQSITQEQEEDSLKRRFGRDVMATPFDQRDDRVQLRESGGAHGPDRYIRRRLLVLLLLILIGLAAGAGYVYKHPELRQQLLGR